MTTSDWLIRGFATICGENPRHIWSPGGLRLPCCERCTGLYAGALIAVALHLWIRPRIGKRFLELHALCLLQLGLFLSQRLPDSAALRTVSGALFGFGVIGFLWLALPAGSLRQAAQRAAAKYSVGFAISLVLIPALAQWGGRSGATILECMIAAGALALAVLVCANLIRCGSAARQSACFLRFVR
jgi:uncharacterized membrane protein